MKSCNSRSLAFCLACLALALCFLLPARVQAADLVKVPTAWVEEHETFLIWYAKEKGWDKEVGLDLKIKYYNSTEEILNGLPAREWVFAGMGTISATLGQLRQGTIVIGNANDEAMSNGIVVRPGSEIAKASGANTKYPELLGSKESVRGKTFLCTGPGSAYHVLVSWLQALGLEESDVVIKNREQSQGLADFENNIGDGLALWAPQLFLAMEKGYVLAADLSKLGKRNPVVLVADSGYAEENPEIVAKFLGIYLRSANMIQNEKPEDLVAEYKRFYLEWAGKDYTDSVALLELVRHPVFNLAEQLAMFDDSKGQSQAQRWQEESASFLLKAGRITAKDMEKLKDGKYVTNRFLKMVTNPLPDYK